MKKQAKDLTQEERESFFYHFCNSAVKHGIHLEGKLKDFLWYGQPWKIKRDALRSKEDGDIELEGETTEEMAKSFLESKLREFLQEEDAITPGKIFQLLSKVGIPRIESHDLLSCRRKLFIAVVGNVKIEWECDYNDDRILDILIFCGEKSKCTSSMTDLEDFFK